MRFIGPEVEAEVLDVAFNGPERPVSANFSASAAVTVNASECKAVWGEGEPVSCLHCAIAPSARKAMRNLCGIFFIRIVRLRDDYPNEYTWGCGYIIL